MALSLTWRIAVCLPLVVLITGLSDFHLQSSFFTYGPEAQEYNPKCHKTILNDGIAIINKGMTMMYGIDLTKGYYKAVEEFYDKMTNDDKAFDKIKEYLKKMFTDTKQLIDDGAKHFKGTKYDNKTQALLIYLYTKKSEKEKNSIYLKLNKILRDHSIDCGYTVGKDEEHVAPYAAALTATLLHWDSLKTPDAITYRGIQRTICEANDPIVWYSFTSSSTSKTQAKKYGTVTTYTIHNNGIDKKWQPKLIAEFSAAKTENEALYPPGSVFLFKNVIHIGTKIAYDIALENSLLGNTQCNNWENYP